MENSSNFYPHQQLSSCVCPSISQNYLNDLLISAVRSGNVRGVEELLAQGASANARDAHGNTAFHWVAMPYMEENPNARRIAVMLLNKGANPYATNNSGETALDWAVRDNTEFVDFIEDLKRDAPRWEEVYRNPAINPPMNPPVWQQWPGRRTKRAYQ